MICCESGDIWWPIIAVFIAPRLRHRHGTAWCLFTFCPRVNPRALFKLGFCFFFSRRGGEHPRIDKRIHLESGAPRQDIYIDTLQILAFSFCNRYLTLSSKRHETAFRNSWLSMEKKKKTAFSSLWKVDHRGAAFQQDTAVMFSPDDWQLKSGNPGRPEGFTLAHRKS